MAEEEYLQYKEDESTVGTTSRHGFREPLPKERRPMRRRRPRPSEDYTTYKAVVAIAVEDIKSEIRDQHQLTRAEVQTVRRDVLSAIKASPAEYIKLLCELGSLFLVFSLAIRILLKIELVNPAFALFMLAALAVYWAMARLKQESDKSAREDQQT